jgi:hypothetical protein
MNRKEIGGDGKWTSSIWLRTETSYKVLVNTIINLRVALNATNFSTA